MIHFGLLSIDIVVHFEIAIIDGDISITQTKMVYYGEQSCQSTLKSKAKLGQPCTNKAYYDLNGVLLCGLHSKGKGATELPKNPQAKAIKAERLSSHSSTVEDAALVNRTQGKKGSIIVTKMKRMKANEDISGYMKIFPNIHHGNRSDGLGCPTLSPMSLGPVNHIMPNLPPAQTIELFHQSAKIFQCDVDANEDPTPEALQKRIDDYNNPIARRHKYDAKEILKMASENKGSIVIKKEKKPKNVNIPLYSLFYTDKGEERRFTYFGARYFYCKAYERLAPLSPEFAKLKDLINNGYNLQIIGYDGYPISDSLLNHYYDTSRPFGHELVLYTLLTVADPKDYPWNITYEANKSLYDGVGL
jgi:hypothetical protein